MLLSQLLETIKPKIKKRPQNYMLAILSNVASSIVSWQHRIKEYIFTSHKKIQLDLEAATPNNQSFWQKVNVFRIIADKVDGIITALKALALIVVLALLCFSLVALTTFLGPLNVLSFAAASLALGTVSTLLCEVYCLLYNFFNYTCQDPESEYDLIALSLLKLTQNNESYHTQLRYQLIALAQDFSAEGLLKLRVQLEAIDIKPGAALDSLGLPKRLQVHFSSEIEKYLQYLSYQAEKADKEVPMTLKHLVGELLFNPNEPWHLREGCFLTRADRYLLVQKILKEDFSVPLCYKKALLYQMRTHRLYLPEIHAVPKDSSLTGELSLQRELIRLVDIIELLATLGCQGDKRLKATLRRQLEITFYQLDKKQSFEYTDYLDRDFFGQLDRLCQQSRPLIEAHFKQTSACLAYSNLEDKKEKEDIKQQELIKNTSNNTQATTRSPLCPS